MNSSETIDHYKSLLDSSQETVREYENIFQQLREPPFVLCTVLDCVDNSSVLLTSPRTGDVVAPYPNKRFIGSTPVETGIQFYLNPETLTIGGKSEYVYEGDTAVVIDKIDNKTYEVEVTTGTKIVFSSIQLRNGQKVSLDFTGRAVIKILEESKTKEEFVSNIDLDDIGGLENVKVELLELVEHPILYHELYKKYNKKLPKGILFYGPPGCGKTLIGKALSKMVANLYNNKEDSSGYFIYKKGTEFFNPYVGVGEAKIRTLFLEAKNHKEESGYPAIIFIDEAEVCMKKRGMGISSDVNDNLVASFLTEMDGMEEHGSIVILATNRPDIIDPAILREGRIDKKILIPRPNKSQCKKILEIYLSKTKIEFNQLEKNEFINTIIELIFEKYKLSSKISGAMIENIVNDSITFALRNDIKNSKSNAKGIDINDIEAAIEIAVSSSNSLGEYV